MANIVETAISAGTFKTLVKAVQAAGLAETLSGPGPFTVFAPTDEAFAKLPRGTIEGLLNDIPQLKQILTYHVVPGKMMAEDVTKMHELKTVQGQSLNVDASRWHMHRNVKISGADIIKPDIKADNGVIHVIDQVLMPKPAPARAH